MLGSARRQYCKVRHLIILLQADVSVGFQNTCLLFNLLLKQSSELLLAQEVIGVVERLLAAQMGQVAESPLPLLGLPRGGRKKRLGEGVKMGELCVILGEMVHLVVPDKAIILGKLIFVSYEPKK